MTSRGGRIPPDGRKPQASGVGRNARRHDLERPRTPGLYDSDLQQGDVQALEQGQRIVPPRTQQPAQTQRPNAGRQPSPVTPQGGPQNDVPDPIDFLGDRLLGTLEDPDSIPVSHKRADLHTWMPLIKRLATAPGASGALAQAYITMLHNAANTPFRYETPLIDLQEADDAAAAIFLGE